MTSRRDFIKISALGLGGASIGLGTYIALKANPADELVAGDFPRIPTYCEVCFWKCAAWAYKDKDGKLAKLIGNENDPHCNGRLCPRGTGGIGMYYDTDRLTTPLIRVAEGGKQTFQPSGPRLKSPLPTHGHRAGLSG